MEELKPEVNDSVKMQAKLSQKLEVTGDRDNYASKQDEAIKRFEEGNQTVETLKDEVVQLENEINRLKLALGAITQETSQIKLEIDLSKQETENLKDYIRVAEEENRSLSMKMTLMSNELKVAQDIMEELKAESSNSSKKLAERDSELLSIRDKLDAHTTGASEWIKALEEHIGSLKIELQRITSDKSEMEGQTESKSTEGRQLGGQVEELRAHLSQMATKSKEREEYIPFLQEKLEAAESDSNSRIEAMIAQVSNMTEHIKKVYAENSQLEEMARSNKALDEIRELHDQISSLGKEVEALKVQEREMKLDLERKGEDIAEYKIQIEGLHEKLSSSDALLKQLFEEKESLASKLKDRDLEVEIINHHKTGMEEQSRSTSSETAQLKEETTRLQEQIEELEKALREREDESFAIQKRLEDGGNEASSKITTLLTENGNLKIELETIQAVKSQLETQVEKEKQELLESLNVLETENAELKVKMEDHLGTIKELQDELNSKKEQCEHLKTRVQENVAELQEGKIKEFNDDMSMSYEPKDERILELEVLVEDLKRDLEVATDEEKTAWEKTRTIEVQLRLANQKLRITEQLLSEKEEEFKIAEKKYQEECKVLEDKATKLSEVLAANNEAYRGMIMDMSESMNKILAEMELIIMKFEEDCERFSKVSFTFSEEVQILMHYVTEQKSERAQLQEQTISLTEKLRNERQLEEKMRAKMEKLENEYAIEKEEKENLVIAVSELKKATGDMNMALKEKDERLTVLGEEKRQAIRQLCLWCDEMRDQYDELKKTALKANSQQK